MYSENKSHLISLTLSIYAKTNLRYILRNVGVSGFNVSCTLLSVKRLFGKTNRAIDSSWLFYNALVN